MCPVPTRHSRMSDERKDLLDALRMAVNVSRKSTQLHLEAHENLQKAFMAANNMERQARADADRVRTIHLQLGAIAIDMI